jgi:hypothetical protein
MIQPSRYFSGNCIPQERVAEITARIDFALRTALLKEGSHVRIHSLEIPRKSLSRWGGSLCRERARSGDAG